MIGLNDYIDYSKAHGRESAKVETDKVIIVCELAGE